MELSDEDIALIERYLQNDLAGEDLSAFKQRMDSDPDFAREVEDYSSVLGSIKLQGRDELKQRVGAIGASLAAEGGLNDYTPPKSGGAGGIVKTILVLAVAGGGIYYYITKSEEGKQSWMENIEKIFKQETKTVNDTIWYTTPGVPEQRVIETRRETTYVKQEVPVVQQPEQSKSDVELLEVDSVVFEMEEAIE